MNYLKEKKTNIIYNLYSYKNDQIKIDQNSELFLLG